MTGLIYELIPKVMGDIGAVAKTRKNEQQKYQFRGIEDFYLAAHPAMVAHGIFCAPEAVERTEYRFEKTNDYGKTTTWLHVTLKVVHRFYASDGSYVSVTSYGEGLDNSDKATNKAMSGAMKYALIELFCVPTQDVEDSDRTTPEAGVQRKGEIMKEEITLVPTPPAAPVKLPDTKVDPALAFDDPEYITKDQRQYLARRFRESLKPELSNKEGEYRHAALTAMAQSGKFKSKLIDDNGNPTSEYILASEYKQAGQYLVKAAQVL